MNRPPTSSAFLRVVLVATLGLLVAACAAKQPIEGQEASGQSRKLSTFAYIEEGKIVALVVDVQAARYRDGVGYVPLEIAIANKGLKRLMLTRESFTLIDAKGNRYPAATPKELIENYEFLDLDRKPPLAELNGLTDSKFAAYTRYPSKFSPTRDVVTGSSALVRDLVALPRYGYLLDFIYFPEPPTGIKGQQFELFLDSPDLEDPVFVKFTVN